MMGRVVGLVGMAVALVFSAAIAGAQSGELGKVLAQMDTASAKFESSQADFEWDQYEKVVDEHESQSGTIYFDRKGGGTWMAAHLLKPDEKVVVYKMGELQFFQPKIDQVTIFAAGVNRMQYESFLTLGFGGSGHDLAANWDITYKGMESVDGIQTARLDMVPKQDSVKKMFDHVTVWIDPSRAISMKQQFFESSGDVRTAAYSRIKYNEKVPASAFTLKTSSKTQIVRK
jgi:outer membrane lipoprotein-sorting protein